MKIIPNKVIINLDDKGNYNSGIIIYRKEDKGNIQEKYYTASFASSIPGGAITSILSKIMQFVKKQENANE